MLRLVGVKRGKSALVSAAVRRARIGNESVRTSARIRLTEGRKKDELGGRNWKEMAHSTKSKIGRTHGRYHISINEFSGYRVYFRSGDGNRSRGQVETIAKILRRSSITSHNRFKTFNSRENRKIARTVITWEAWKVYFTKMTDFWNGSITTKLDFPRKITRHPATPSRMSRTEEASGSW